MQSIGFYAVVIGFAAGVAGASIYRFSWTAVGLAVLLCVCFALGYVSVKRPAYLVALFFLLAFSAGSARTWIVPTHLPDEFVPLLDERSTFEGTIVAYPDARESSARLTVETEKDSITTRVIAVAPAHTEFRVGDRVSVSGTLSLPEAFETAGNRTFAYDTFLAKDGVFAILSPARVEVIGRDRQLSLQVLRILGSGRNAFMQAVGRAIPEPESALAAGLIVGGKQGLGKSLLADFTTAGLIHVVVLSGYNVTIVA
jgi:competence protein ComEC